MNLYELSESYKQVSSMLEDGADDTAVLDTLASINEEITVKAQNICHVIKQSEYNVQSIDEEIKRLQALKQMQKNKVDYLKKYIFDNMNELGKEKINTKTHVLSIRKNPPALVIDDAEKIPTEYQIVIPATYEVDKKSLKEALKNGAEIPGARLTQGTRLDIK